MKKLIIEKFQRILKNKKKLEEKLDVKITNRGKEIYFEGNPEEEYVAERVIEALDFGFPFSTAMLIKEEDFLFEVINLKEHSVSKNFSRIRGRIIGQKGKCLKTLSGLTNCYFELKDNTIGIIGGADEIKNAQDAVISIIKGTKHGNVYAYLEKCKPQFVEDLGLKREKK